MSDAVSTDGRNGGLYIKVNRLWMTAYLEGVPETERVSVDKER